MDTILGSRIPLTKSEQMIGISSHLPINNLYNHICTIVKRYIYVCRCVAKMPSSATLKIKDEINTKYVLASEKNRTALFTENWQGLCFI